MKRSIAAKIWVDYHMTHSKKKSAKLTRLPLDTMAIQPKFHVSTPLIVFICILVYVIKFLKK